MEKSGRAGVWAAAGVLALLALALVFASFGGARYESCDDLAEAVVSAIVRDDRSDFEAAFMTRSDFQGLLAKTTSERVKDRAARALDRFEAERDKALDRAWEQVAKGLERDRVDRTLLEIVKVKYEVRVRHGVEQCDVYITLREGGRHYELKLDDCVRADRGWVMSDLPRWRGRRSRRGVDLPAATTEKAESPDRR